MKWIHTLTPVNMGARYHHHYLKRLNLERKGGYLITDQLGRTSHPRIFAIGDLEVGLNQVTVAVGDGAVSAPKFGERFVIPGSG